MTSIALFVIVVESSKDKAPGDSSVIPLVLSIFVFALVGSILMGIAFGLLKKLPKYVSKYSRNHLKQKNMAYSKLFLDPFEKTDFKKEIEITRSNFAADTDLNKNTITYKENNQPFYDYRTLKCGKIYYGCLVMTNTMLFEKKAPLNEYPAEILYGEDPYFDENPLALIPVAEQFFVDIQKLRKAERKRVETTYVYNKRFTHHFDLNGEKVEKKLYTTTLMIDRTLLPMNVLCARIFPIIAAPGQSTSVFTVDDKYWSANMVVNYIYNNYERKAKIEG